MVVEQGPEGVIEEHGFGPCVNHWGGSLGKGERGRERERDRDRIPFVVTYGEERINMEFCDCCKSIKLCSFLCLLDIITFNSTSMLHNNDVIDRK